MVQPTRRFQWRAVGAALVVAWAASALAQTVAATVRGTVTDPTGGAIPAAKAILINLDTGDERRTTTNSSGAYVFAEAPVGTYDLFIEADGFRPYVQRTRESGVTGGGGGDPPVTPPSAAAPEMPRGVRAALAPPGDVDI